MVYVAVRPPADRAASGGLDGGDMYPELTSGIPLCPVGAGSGVVKALQQGEAIIDNVATGEDIRTTRGILAIIITTSITTAIFLVRHFEV